MLNLVHCRGKGLLPWTPDKTWMCITCFRKGTTPSFAAAPCEDMWHVLKTAKWWTNLPPPGKAMIIKVSQMPDEKAKEIDEACSNTISKPRVTPKVLTQAQRARSALNTKARLQKARIARGFSADPRGVGGRVAGKTFTMPSPRIKHVKMTVIEQKAKRKVARDRKNLDPQNHGGW